MKTILTLALTFLLAWGTTAAPVVEQWRLPDAIQLPQPPTLLTRTLSSTQFLGKVVVLNFFATWCVPCAWEARDFVALQNEHGRQGLVVIGVGVRQKPAELRGFMEKQRITYAVGPSTEALLWKYGVLPAGAIPVTVIFDRQGNQVGRWTYYHTKSFYNKIVTPLLAIQN